jgi:hypothetical protein
MTPGQTVTRRGQLYRCVSCLEHQMRNGAWVDLIHFESVCPECGRTFECTATRTAIKRGYLTRRCEDHRRPGAPVGERRPPRKTTTVRTAPPHRPRPLAPNPERPTVREMLA